MVGYVKSAYLYCTLNVDIPDVEAGFLMRPITREDADGSDFLDGNCLLTASARMLLVTTGKEGA